MAWRANSTPISAIQNKKVRAEMNQHELLKYLSGPDGTRTRDLRRDRAAF
jgi:hypothetical protein